MWELNHKEGWALKNWCFRTVMLEKTLESPSDSKEVKPVKPRGNQPWILNGRTDVETEAPILWSPDVKSWLIGKDSDAGKDWGQEEKGATEDEMFEWHHRLNRHEFEQALGDGEGQVSLAWYSPWVHKEMDTIEQLTTMFSQVGMIPLLPRGQPAPGREMTGERVCSSLHVSWTPLEVCMPLCSPTSPDILSLKEQVSRTPESPFHLPRHSV